MIISLSEFKANVGRYVDLAEMEDVVITKYGKPAAKIVRIDKKDRCAKEIPVHIGSVAQLFGTLPGNADWKVIKQERLTT